jgi:hypothetical protein
MKIDEKYFNIAKNEMLAFPKDPQMNIEDFIGGAE